MQNEDLSIADGAIAPWATMNYLQPVLDALAKHYKFSLDTPWKEIPLKTRKAIMNGSGSEEIEFAYERGHHRAEYSKTFEGVLQWLDRRYKETESEGVREFLEAYMNMRPCPTCDGARLKKESLFVRFNNKSISEVTAMSIEQALAFFAAPKLSAQEAEIGRTHFERNSRAPEFPRRRRPRVPHPRSPVRQSLRRRGPAHPSRHPNRLEPRRRALHPRRAVNWTPSARQSAPARAPSSASRNSATPCWWSSTIARPCSRLIYLIRRHARHGHGGTAAVADLVALHQWPDPAVFRLGLGSDGREPRWRWRSRSRPSPSWSCSTTSTSRPYSLF